jgi:predicted membrane channel-forming protein YqfA (hemolysin III family)
MILISTILLVIFLVNFLNHHETHNHEHGGSLHLFALGGVLGCVGSHMYYHIFKEKD